MRGETINMAGATKSKQFSFSMPNKVGLLSGITTAIAGAKVKIEFPVNPS